MYKVDKFGDDPRRPHRGRPAQKLPNLIDKWYNSPSNPGYTAPDAMDNDVDQFPSGDIDIAIGRGRRNILRRGGR